MYKDLFFFDIETTSKSPSLFDLKLDDPRGAELFMKKCMKMKQYPNSEWSDKPCDELYIDKAPILPEFGKIICMSFGVFTGDKKHVTTIIEDDEKILMKRIAHVFNRASQTKKRLFGFNVKAFDIPWIVRKLYKYDIDIPLCLNFINIKPWEMMVDDLLDIWKGTGKYNMPMDDVAYDLGIESPKEIMSGEQVHDYYWIRMDTASIVKYCEGDVDCMIKIAEKLNL